jgi:hypothetical protein
MGTLAAGLGYGKPDGAIRLMTNRTFGGPTDDGRPGALLPVMAANVKEATRGKNASRSTELVDGVLRIRRRIYPEAIESSIQQGVNKLGKRGTSHEC